MNFYPATCVAVIVVFAGLTLVAVAEAVRRWWLESRERMHATTSWAAHEDRVDD